MTENSTQEELRLKITSYMFNRRADALRGEMYEALCLGAFADAKDSLTSDEIASRVASQLGEKVKVSESLRTIVYDGLISLEKNGAIIRRNNEYSLDVSLNPIEFQKSSHIELEKSLSKPIEKIAFSINQDLSPASIKKSLHFFVEASSIIANDQASSLSKGNGTQSFNYEEKDDVPFSVIKLWEEYDLGKELDFDKFITKTLLNPEGELADYLYRLIQVNIIIRLLSWDPNLEFLKNTLLANKVLYLDSSVLFVLMQRYHPLHYFLLSMLRASKNDLGVVFKVHETTIKEYQNAIEWAERENSHSYKDLKIIAQICKSEGSSPFEFIDNATLADYVSENMDRLDVGTWQKYKTSLTGRSFHDMLASLSAETEKQKISVPYEELNQIKETMVRASQKQVERKKRANLKYDTDHDARIFYRIKSSRKRSTEASSIGFDKYLLTLDGSLTYFSRLFEIPVTETFFIFPNQWYELAFPFLRLESGSVSQITSGVVSMFFSRAFPKLTTLIPLELCKYIFENGGQGLTTGSIKAVAESMTEERLLDSLRPDNDDLQKKEQAQLRVARLIAEEEIKRNKELKIAERLTEELKKTQQTLSVDVENLSSKKEQLTSEIGDIDQLQNKINLLEKTQSQELNAMQDKLDKILLEQKNTKEEKETETRLRRVNISTALMIFGLLGGLIWLLQSSIFYGWTILFVIVMVIGIAFYNRTASTVVLVVTLLSGLLLTILLTQSKIDTITSIIGLGWSILTYVVDFLLKDRKKEKAS